MPGQWHRGVRRNVKQRTHICTKVLRTCGSMISRANSVSLWSACSDRAEWRISPGKLLTTTRRARVCWKEEGRLGGAVTIITGIT